MSVSALDKVAESEELQLNMMMMIFKYDDDDDNKKKIN